MRRGQVRRTVNIPERTIKYIAIDRETGEILECRDPVVLVNEMLRWVDEGRLATLTTSEIEGWPLGVIEATAAEMKRQDAIHPAGYPATRDGIRLAIAAAQDELFETHVAWLEGRCKCPEPMCDHPDWREVRVEAIQAAAVLLRMAANIEEAS